MEKDLKPDSHCEWIPVVSGICPSGYYLGHVHGLDKFVCVPSGCQQ